MEYFCFEGDGLWNMQDSDLVELAKKEVVKLNLVSEEDVLNGFVIRQPKAYPVYDDNYKAHLEVIKNGLSGYKNLYAVGRNGMHRYNNQDHSMMTAILAARNIIAGENVYDLWEVNEDAEYHEEVKDNQTVTERLVPKKVISS